jgi:hypothetical protein
MTTAVQLDETGLIKQLTVMVRPEPAVRALGAAVHAGGLIPVDH